MPGKITRESYEQRLRDIFGDTPPVKSKGPQTLEESNDFLCAVLRGLLDRLRCEGYVHHEAINEGIKFAAKHFGTWVENRGREWAKHAAMVSPVIFSKRLINRAKKPSPPELLSEHTRISRMLDSIKKECELVKRLKKEWGFPSDKAKQLATGYSSPTASLIEEILGTYYKMSESAIHKALANAEKIRKPPKAK